MEGSRRFKKAAAGAGLAVTLAGVPLLLFYLYGKANVEPITLGCQLPDIPVHTWNGGLTSLQAMLSRKAVVLVFTVDCPHCVNEVLHFAALHVTKKDSLQFVFVSLSSTDETRQFFSTWRDKVPIVLADPGKAREALGIITLPSLFCINGDGRVLYRRFGERPFEADERLVHTLIREVLP